MRERFPVNHKRKCYHSQIREPVKDDAIYHKSWATIVSDT